jgi:hypothetical protein
MTFNREPIAAWKGRMAAVSVIIALIATLIADAGMVSAEQYGDFEYRLVDGGRGAEITGYTGPGGAVTIPGAISGRPVVSVGNGSFRSCLTITSVKVPDTVITINERAFQNCPLLTSADLGRGVVSVGALSFLYCVNLTSINMPDSVRAIGDLAFLQCTRMSAVHLGSNVKAIGNYSFDGCYGLREISMPPALRSIGEGAFNQCFSLTSISLPSGITRVENYTFQACKALERIDIPASVVYIGKYAFFDCRKLVDAAIPDGVKTVNWGTFSNCVSLASVRIGASVTKIDHQAFLYCTSLRTVTIPAGVSFLGTVSFGVCTNLTSVLFQGNAPECGERVFSMAAADLMAYYIEGSRGWTDPWQGVPTVAVRPASAPTNLTVAPGNACAKLNWIAPLDNGGGSIDYYVIFMNGEALSEHVTATSANVTGLRNGILYSFTVAAHNLAGAGPNSTQAGAMPQNPELGTFLLVLGALLLAFIAVDIALLASSRRR